MLEEDPAQRMCAEKVLGYKDGLILAKVEQYKGLIREEFPDLGL